MSNYPYVDMIRTKTHADGMLPVHIIVKNRKAEKRKVDINDFWGAFQGRRSKEAGMKKESQESYINNTLFIIYNNIIIL